MEISPIAAAAFAYRFVAGRIKHEYFNEFAAICVAMVVVLMLLTGIGIIAVIT